MPVNIMLAFLLMPPKWFFFSFRTKTACSTRSCSDCHMPCPSRP